MKSLANLRIGTRLILAFAGITGLLIAIAAIGIIKINVVSSDTEIILHDRYVKVALAQTIENEVNKQSRALRTALIATDPTVSKGELAKLEASVPVVVNAIERLEATIRTEQGKAGLQALEQARNVFKEREHRLVDMIKAAKLEEGRAYLIAEILPVQGKYLEAIEAFAQTQVEGMEAFGREAAEEAHAARILMITLSVIAVVLAAVIGFLLTRSITVPIAEAVQVARTVAAGDLTSRIEVMRRDETGELLSALKSMNESLGRIVDQVRTSSDSIATGATQIANGNADLSHRTEEQASNLEETAASMEEITATVKHSADAAHSAAELASTANRAASEGGAVVTQVIETMDGISASSRKIADITGVIDGIAFQTNILALNAAVEAARAGEQGRGFAVVAGEVRTLAQRAAGAAKEIKLLIGDSVARVETGAQLVAKAGTTMQQIVEHVSRVTQLIAEINVATQEQTTGISQVSEAVNQLDQVTQQNAALVEESAAAADSLSQQALKLTDVVRAFKLDGGMPSAATA